jgi:phenylalanyl-tRNA synthetase alpha chain
MSFTFSEAQEARLTGLGLEQNLLEKSYETAADRDAAFKGLEKKAVAENRGILLELLGKNRETKMVRLKWDLAAGLRGQGFTRVETPAIIPKLFLERMSINKDHALNKQVFWLDENRCLRPMLAPNLYAVSQKLLNFAPLPLRIFEIGSCFRKESEGKFHLREFTMLNLVEWGTPEPERVQRIKDLAAVVLEAAKIEEWRFEEEFSTVYGNALDVVDKNGTELASTSMGPHPLDPPWKITCSWVGAGFGLERLLISRENEQGVHRYGRSTTFLDGAALNIK